MNKTKTKTVIICFFSIGFLLMLGTVAFVFLGYPPNTETDAFLSYEKMESGPSLQFSDVEHSISNENYDASYKEEKHTNYYHYLSHAAPEEMLILHERERGLWPSNAYYLLYNPERVADPWTKIKPCKATLSVQKKNRSYMTVEFSDPAVWESLWQTLLDSEPTTTKYEFDSTSQATFWLYLDSDMQIRIECLIRKKDGMYWYVISSMQSSSRYVIPCSDEVVNIITAYMAIE